jgi:hypothetical protein
MIYLQWTINSIAKKTGTLSFKVWNKGSPYKSKSKRNKWKASQLESKKLKCGCLAGHQRLTTLIIATQKAESRWIAVQSQPQANNAWVPISKKKNPSQKKDWWSGSRCRPWVQTLVPLKKKKRKKRNVAVCCIHDLIYRKP